ncbi:DUF3781 domain-containing protein [uncultured Polaribacter sp.]|uniref:DUF3781 domain-containing protein n=1 Tax=uncultured Polaribacter sp. TaxID=174711 RepID=UPI002602832B|nr:DUF3781 domain-containing protein [uncultured Polaribacter sp.]
MIIDKPKIIKNHCFTELVYQRINRKLKLNYSKIAIETFIKTLLIETPLINYIKKGKNFYILNKKHQVRITVNSTTFRIITVDKTINSI